MLSKNFAHIETRPLLPTHQTCLARDIFHTLRPSIQCLGVS
jgi:hypothetical protein